MSQGLGRLIAERYRLGDVLGAGGMGKVWRAHDEFLKRDVAVKELVLPSEVADSDRRAFCARTIREARSAARLSHPGIVTIHDVIEQGGLPWIIMELIPGRSLDELITAEGPLAPRVVARIGLQVLAALRAAHAANVTHRDVKPSNILLRTRQAVLTDFGIATIEGDSTITSSGVIIGTPAFMAPEQARGSRATAESDLWSLGATLYAAVEGRPPYTGPSVGAVFMALASEDPAPTRNAGSLKPVIEGLLRKDPRQ
jgi:serine/threonine protein kinase